MAEGATSLKGLRAQMAAAAQAQAEERRSLSGNSPGPPAANPPSTTAKPQGPRPVIDGAALRIDDRLRVAKERREEADKQQAARESQILEREQKAKRQLERQLEERHRKLEEQRRKEEQRRSAVEEKRRQKQEEEKEHYEAVMRRTLERSQRVEHRQKRWSWGGLATDTDGRPGDSDGGASSPVAIVISPASPEKPPRTRQVDKRSTSTMNLKQSSEAGISKRLSSSSATLINSPDKSVKRRSSSLNRLPNNGTASQPPKEASKKPQVEQTGPSLKKRSSSLTRDGRGKTPPPAKLDKGPLDEQARRALLSPMEGGLVSRLLTPTQASLARSKSAAALSAQGADAPASASPLHPPPRGPVRSRSIDRQKSSMPTSVSADGPLDPSLKEKRFTSPGGSKRPASPASTPGRNRSPSPAPLPSPKRTPSPAAAKQSPRNRPSSPGGHKQRPPSPQTTSTKPPPIQKPALTPTGPPTLRKRDSKAKELCPIQPVAPQTPEAPQASTAPTSSSKTKEDSKAMAGTNSAAEAAKILAENRRLAREQKEKEELLRAQREEEERLRKEEEQRLAEEARLQRVEEQKRLAEEKKKQEEEEALRAEEDRERLEAEEAVKQAELQKEREEAEARALVEAERLRVERERIMEKNQQERMERKKRIEEIMKRTRKGEQNDFKREGEEDGDEDGDEDGEEEGGDEEGGDEEGGDEEGGDEEGEEEVDQMNCETMEKKIVPSGDVAMEMDITVLVGRGLPIDGPMGEREEPLGSVNGKPEGNNKENNNGSKEEPLAVSPVPEGRLVEGSEFLNEDSNKLVPGLNGKPGPWSFEEIIDLNVHSKGRPLLQAPEGLGQGLINCDEGPDGPRVAFEDKGAPVTSLHPSSQPIEALSEM